MVLALDNGQQRPTFNVALYSFSQAAVSQRWWCSLFVLSFFFRSGGQKCTTSSPF
jgi:hypothetical protein